jgi:hypothetical protein
MSIEEDKKFGKTKVLKNKLKCSYESLKIKERKYKIGKNYNSKKQRYNFSKSKKCDYEENNNKQKE